MEASMEVGGGLHGGPWRSVEVRGGLHGIPWSSVEVSTEVRGGPWRFPHFRCFASCTSSKKNWCRMRKCLSKCL